MSDNWKLDNYQAGKRGYKPKSGGTYVVRYELDVDGDGDFEKTSEELTYDLRFKHLVHDGVIFLRTVPISQDLRHKKLAVLMDRFVEEVAGAGYEIVQFNQQTKLLVEKRYAAAVIEKGDARLASLPAYAATMDIANVDQIKVDPNARKERVQLVLLHTPFSYRVGRGVNEKKKNPHQFPVLMVAGYANQPEDFQAGLAEFHDLLGRVVISGQSGFSAKLAPVQPPVPAQPAAPANTPPVAPAAAPAAAAAQPTAPTPTPATPPQTTPKAPAPAPGGGVPLK